jgi:hypothetical protein
MLGRASSTRFSGAGVACLDGGGGVVTVVPGFGGVFVLTGLIELGGTASLFSCCNIFCVGVGEIVGGTPSVGGGTGVLTGRTDRTGTLAGLLSAGRGGIACLTPGCAERNDGAGGVNGGGSSVGVAGFIDGGGRTGVDGIGVGVTGGVLLGAACCEATFCIRAFV